MAIKDKPVCVFLLRYPGKKTQKVEIFSAGACGRKVEERWTRKFRLRVNGRWWGGRGKGKEITELTRWEIRDLLWRSLEW